MTSEQQFSRGVATPMRWSWGVCACLVIGLLSSCQWSADLAPAPTLDSDAPTTAQADTQWTPPPPLKASQRWQILVAVKDTYDPQTQQHGDLYQAQIWQGAQTTAEKLGVNVQLLPNDCHTCVEKQIRAIAKQLEKGNLDGIVMMATDSVRLATIVERAIAQGIPVIAVDTPINSDQILSLVTFDNVTGGELMGQWVVHQLGGQGNVLLLDGALEQQNAIDRKQGFLAGLKTGEIDVLDTRSGNWSQATAQEITQDWLQRFGQVDAIVAANYAMAQGAADAVQDAGKAGDILITGFDAMPDALAAIADGAIAATINQVPEQQSQLALELLVRHLETQETFPQQVLLPQIYLINQANIEEILKDAPPAN